MTTEFQARIDKAMERYRHVKVPEGGHTIGAFVQAVLEIHEETEAAAFWTGYVDWLKRWPSKERAEANGRSNIGWCFGEGMDSADVAMWRKVCNASHPVFGTMMPTRPEDAFQAGCAVAEAEKGGNE